METISSAMPRPAVEEERRRAVVGGILSTFVDSYDIYLPAIVLPAAMGYFEPANLPTAIKVTFTSLIFTATLIGRPLGSPIFGHFSDKVGRKRVAMITAAGYTLCTLIMALLPGYAAWGYWPLILTIVLRLIDGMFLAGGYAATIPLALERARWQVRGRVSGLLAAAAPAALTAINLVLLFALHITTRAGYQTWGWRIPFLVGVGLGVLFLLYYSRVSELELEQAGESRAQRRPLRELVRGNNLVVMAEVALLSSGYWLAAQMVVSYLPVLLVGVLHEPPTAVGQYGFFTGFLNIAVMLLFGLVGNKLGSRRLMLLTGAWTASVAAILWFLMIHLAQVRASFWWVAVLAFVAHSLVAGTLGALFAYLNEVFPTRVRSTGFSVGYTIGLIIPGFYSVWLLGLSHWVPYAYASVVLLALGGLMCLAGTWLAPQGRPHQDLLAE